MGCFLNGDDYGVVVAEDMFSAPWWSVNFPNLRDGFYRHPVQLYEAAYAVISTAGLAYWVLPKWHPRAGVASLVTVCGYAVFRFFCEYYRGDDRGWIVQDTMSPSQFVSILLLFVALPLCVIRLRRN